MIPIRIKSFFLLMILLLSVLVLVACTQIDGSSNMEAIQSSISDYISSKDSDYDFIQDEDFMNKIEIFINTMTKSYDIDPEHFAVGHLNKDNIPEIVYFREKDPNNINDEGYLEVYGYDGEKYALMDKTSMNFDKTNYQLVLGRVSEDANGIYLNNEVGSHSSITYGFILKDNKLKSILNPKKVNLISSTTDNEIKDINQNGILEFSISTPDPENIDNSQKENIKLWYRWDGHDSANLVDIERNIKMKNLQLIDSDEEVLEKANNLLENNNEKFIPYLIDNQDKISRLDNTNLIKLYIENLETRIRVKEKAIEKLISNYDLVNNGDLLRDKYSLSLELINDIEYLNRKKVLSAEDELKKMLISNLKLGYKYEKDNDEYKIVVNNQLFFDNFRDNILNEYRDYLRIKSNHDNVAMASLNMDELAENIVLIENFSITYPYSSRLDELEDFHNKYLDLFFQLDEEDLENQEIQVASEDNGGLKTRYKEIKEKYSHTYFSDLISKYLSKK